MVRFFLVVLCCSVRFYRSASHRMIFPLAKPHRTAPHLDVGLSETQNPHPNRTAGLWSLKPTNLLGRGYDAFCRFFPGFSRFLPNRTAPVWKPKSKIRTATVPHRKILQIVTKPHHGSICHTREKPWYRVHRVTSRRQMMGPLLQLSLIHIWRCRRSTLCRSRWSPYH